VLQVPVLLRVSVSVTGSALAEPQTAAVARIAAVTTLFTEII
jgi:hypothetical protein